jgi:signal transduction histidine kinase
MAHKLCILVCEFFERETMAVIESEGLNDVAVATFPARCGRPQIKWDELAQIIQASGACDQVHILGGCCVAGIGDPPEELGHAQHEQRYLVHKIEQCFYPLVGRDITDNYLKQGAYLVTPGWLAHWRRHVEELGFDSAQSSQAVREFFNESATRLMLVDTGTDPQGPEHLQEFADFVGLDFDTLPVGLDFYRLFVTKIVLEWRLENKRSDSAQALNSAQRRTADYAMALDLLGNLTRTMTEKEAIANIIDLFSMLFAPQHLLYIPFQDGKPCEALACTTALVDHAAIENRLADFDLQEEYVWTESGSGFLLRIAYRSETLGVLEVDAIPFPEYKDHYLNLALTVANVCGLAISNARIYQQIRQAEETLRQRNQELVLLNQVGQELTSTLDLSQVIERLLKAVTKRINAEGASLWMIDVAPKGGMLCWASSHGDREIAPLNLRLDLGQGVAGWVARTGEGAIVPNVQQDPRFFPGVDERTGFHTRSILAAPLWARDVIIGVLEVVNKLQADFDKNDLVLVETLAASAASAIENARLHQELQDHATQLEKRIRERTALLTTQYARLDAILQSTTDGIAVTDAKGDIVQVNPVAQAWLTQTLTPEGASRLREAVRSVATQMGERSAQTLELMGLDLELSAAPVVEEDSTEPSAAVVSIHDVSHHKTLDRMKTLFIANVSDELRHPVATIKTYGYLMQRTSPESEKWSQYLDALMQEVERQATLVEDIMQISRIYTGRLEIKPRPTNLNTWTKTIIAQHQELAQAQSVTLEYQSTSLELTVPIDQKQMGQVLNNLVQDAIRHTPEGGRVTVSTGAQETEERVWATVAVSDTGDIILPEDLPYIFERFYRKEEPLSQRVSEIGLRPMIAKEIVELHGGRVIVESEQDVSTTFTVWLPLVD